MVLILAVATVSIVALGITFFLTDRSHWRKILLVIGIVGAALSGLQAYRNRDRADVLQNELRALQQKQEYSNMARYNAFGLLGLARAPLTEHSPLNKILGSYLHEVPNNVQWDCIPEAVEAYTEAIKLESKFPFAYYYRAGCEKADNTGDWQHDLDTARIILRITTQIPGHHPNHDEVLKWIEAGDLGKR